MNSLTVSDSERPDSRLSAETIARAGAEQHARRDFVLTYWPPPIPVRSFDWSATDSNTYDGAPDSGNRHQVGRGPTAEAALLDLLRILEEDAADTQPADPQVALSWTERDLLRGDGRGVTALATDHERRSFVDAQMPPERKP